MDNGGPPLTIVDSTPDYEDVNPAATVTTISTVLQRLDAVLVLEIEPKNWHRDKMGESKCTLVIPRQRIASMSVSASHRGPSTK